MNKNVLNTVIQEFINNNLDKNTSSLLLKKHSFIGVNLKEIISQIEAKNKCKSKLPTWFKTPNIYYPSKLNIEQTSSEITARHKQQIVNGKSIIDLTGGFGVDCFYFSKSFNNVTHCEINSELSTIVTHNYNQLKVHNIKTITNDGLEYLKSSDSIYDWIYIDPSRRHDTKGKVFYLNDCLPNVPKQLELLFKHSKNILVKTSPMLDISVGISELSNVKEIHIVAVKNEVKELLFVLEKGYQKEVLIKTVNLKKANSESFNFNSFNEHNAKTNFNDPQKYLYEPNAALLKAGAFKTIAEQLDIYKLHQHAHLYTSNELKDFPGRTFKIIETIPYNKKLISKKFKGQKANITTRNFPESIAQIRKKFQIKDGGEVYVFFTTNHNNEKIVILCSKL